MEYTYYNITIRVRPVTLLLCTRSTQFSKIKTGIVIFIHCNVDKYNIYGYMPEKTHANDDF